MKMPNAGPGAWCAFWLASASGIPSAGSNGYESDIAELYGGHSKKRPGPTDTIGLCILGTRMAVKHHVRTRAANGSIPLAATRAITGTSTDVRPHRISSRSNIDGQQVGRKPTNLEYLTILSTSSSIMPFGIHNR